MSKPEQVLVIEPQNELKFKGPFNVPVTSYMKLTNPSEKPVLFKIKTTAPKKYCVRPNSGLLQAGGNIEIAISLQPVEFASTEKNKHKFMVQSVFAPEGDNYHIEQLWKDTTPDKLMDSKLKCVFEVPTEKNDVQEDPVEQEINKYNETAERADQSINLPELNQLRESEHIMRQENLRLKEEILVLKQKTGSRVSQPINKYTPPATQDYAAILIIAAVVMGILGMILGKFVL